MAYSTTRFSAQFAYRLIDSLQTFIEASTATALAEIDTGLADFKDYQTPTPIQMQAIPAVLAYNAFTRGNRLTLARLDGFAHDLHAYLTTGVRVGGNAHLVDIGAVRAKQAV